MPFAIHPIQNEDPKNIYSQEENKFHHQMGKTKFFIFITNQ